MELTVEQKQKTAIELSNAFDILYNNVNSNKSPGIDEYEKSYFFTKAQDELIKRYAFAHTNALHSGIDGSQKRQIDYSTLITTKELQRNTEANSYNGTNYDLYDFPTDALFVLNESVYNQVEAGEEEDQDGNIKPIYENTNDIRIKKERQVTPITFDQYTALRQKPYPFPPRTQVWRLLHSYADKVISEIISPEPFTKYVIRYVKYPSPIVLENLEEDMSIRGVSEITLPILPEQMWEELIQSAVEIAKQAYNSMGPMDIVRFPENQIVGR